MKFNIKFLYYIITLLLIDISPTLASTARRCSGDQIRNQDIGTSITINETAVINTVCTRISKPGRDTRFISLEILDYPKNYIKILNNSYAFAFSGNKIGNYVIKYRLKVERRGAIGYLNRIMNLNIKKDPF